jgi:hypothetical protein
MVVQHVYKVIVLLLLPFFARKVLIITFPYAFYFIRVGDCWFYTVPKVKVMGLNYII